MNKHYPEIEMDEHGNPIVIEYAGIEPLFSDATKLPEFIKMPDTGNAFDNIMQAVNQLKIPVAETKPIHDFNNPTNVEKAIMQRYAKDYLKKHSKAKPREISRAIIRKFNLNIT